jgi:hypothetical protein
MDPRIQIHTKISWIRNAAKIYVNRHACKLLHSQYMPKLCLPPFPCLGLPSTKEHVLTNCSDYRCSFCPENTFFYLCTCCISLFMYCPFCKSFVRSLLPLRILFYMHLVSSFISLFPYIHCLQRPHPTLYTAKKRLSFFASIIPGQGEFC